jgi:uncharacterized protein HemY
MRKWFILFAVLIVAIVAALWWLGTEVDSSRPDDGEVRMDIDNVY